MEKGSRYRTLIDFTILAAVVIAVRIFVEKLVPFFYESFGLYFSDYMFQTLSNYPLTIGMIIADFFLVSLLMKTIPYGTNSMKRTCLWVGGVVLISFLAAVCLRLFQVTRADTDVPFFDMLYLFTCITNLFFNTIIVAIVDTVTYYRWTNKRALAKEVEKRSQANFQYQLLKSEVNPHFLFNSLNVLDYLINTDPPKASDYVKKLAGVYRYLLKMENQPFVMLEEELDFVHQYVSLLRERFGPGFDFSISLSDDNLEKKIIPCTLQMMIENAVKHNVANKSRVLKIRATQEGRYLVVRNNLQPKKQETSGTGLGLKNIQKQYRILFHEDVIIDCSDEFFEVKIPLID